MESRIRWEVGWDLEGRVRCLLRGISKNEKDHNNLN